MCNAEHREGFTEMKKVLLLVNASAGITQMAYKTYDVIETLARGGYEVTVYPVLPAEGLISEDIIADSDQNFDLIACCGGDGTLHHVINGIMQTYPQGSRPQIGFIPTGSTNDFAKSLGIPSEVGGAAVNLVRGVPFAYDVGSFNEQYFNYVAAFGAFTAITYSTDQNFKNVLGHAAYVLTGISRLQENVTYKCHMKIEADGVRMEDDYIFGAIYNATSVGGISLRNAMNVRLDDGKFGLILIKAPENLQDVGQIVQALMDPNLDSPYVSSFDVENVKLIPDRSAAWTLDGEAGGAPETVEISVQKKALSILIPERKYRSLIDAQSPEE